MDSSSDGQQSRGGGVEDHSSPAAVSDNEDIQEVVQLPLQGSQSRPPAARNTSLPPLPPLSFQIQHAERAAAQQLRASSVINRTEPPRGIDPRRHGTNVPANLIAVRSALINSGSAPPRIIADPDGSLNPPPRPPHSDSVFSAPNVRLNPPGSAGLVRPDGPRNAENTDQTDPVTPAFLAAAAARFTEMSAEELCDAFCTIMPKFAACRRHTQAPTWCSVKPHPHS